MNPGIKDIIQRYHCPSELKHAPIFSGTVLHAGRTVGQFVFVMRHEAELFGGLFYPPEGREEPRSTSLG